MSLPPANPNSLDELFSRDPLGLADSDIDRAVTEFRRMRLTWETGQRVKPRKADTSIKNLSLEDLGLA